MAHQLTETTSRQLTRIATQAQRDSRAPGLAAGVAHRGRMLWDVGVGAADLDDPTVALGVDTQFGIASNTKTFTAVLVMALRDEGRLSLDDEVETHLPGAGHPGVTVRQLLAHSSGMQREPLGDIWETLGQPDPADPVENFRGAERVLAPHDRWHYSNLAYMVLGELVARLDGRSWADSLQARLLDPLELARTTLEPLAPAAGRYYVPPFSDVPVPEPTIMRDVTAPVGGLFSTVSDLVRWHAFLLDPDPTVLSPDTALEMRQPQITVDAGWSEAWGLGLDLVRRGDRIWFGHTGGTPGAITGAFSDAESGLTSIVLMSNSIAREPAATAVSLGTEVLEHDPPPLAPWQPGTEVSEALAPLLGLWFSEGEGFVFSVRRGRLQARGVRDGADHGAQPAVFAADGDDAFRTVSGRERGERLTVRRRADGSVAQLNWATYRFTREPLGFAESAD